jgi:hypothetical protein
MIMEKKSIMPEAAVAAKGSAGFVSEMPETPGLKLPEGKIATATRKTIRPSKNAAE